MRKFKLLVAALLTLAGAGIGVGGFAGTAHASTYMFSTWYWYPNDARMYCDTTIAQRSTGLYCAAGHLAIKYPNQTGYCYRRNTGSINYYNNGSSSWSYTGPLTYVC